MPPIGSQSIIEDAVGVQKPKAILLWLPLLPFACNKPKRGERAHRLSSL